MNQLTPYEAPHWAKCLRSPPLSIVQLATKPTPIHQWNIPNLPSPFTVHIKRDDLVGNVLSGNKCRKAELLLGQALERGCDTLLICGTAVCSNHSTTMAVAARSLGLEPYLFLRSQSMDPDDLGCKGNVMLNRLVGARMILVPAHDYDRSVHPRMWKMEEKLCRQGKNPYVIQVGGSTYVSLFAYISAFDEMIEQGVLENFDDIVVTGGSGGTASGLAIANYLTGQKVKIHAVSVSSPEVLYKQLTRNLITSGLEAKAESILDVIDGYRGEGYNTSTTEELEYITKLSTTTGVLCDPIYTIKGVRGMITEMKCQPSRFKGHRVLFIHTGGTFGLLTGRLDQLVTTSPITNQVSTWENFDDEPTC